MKQRKDPPASVASSTPQDQKQPQVSSQIGATRNREEVRKTAPPNHAPRQSQRPKEKSK